MQPVDTTPAPQEKADTVSPQDFLRELTLFAGQAVLVILIAAAALLAPNFPFNTDRALPPAEAAKALQFYATAYDQQKSAAVSPEEEKYARVALEAAQLFHVKDRVRDFAHDFDLHDKKVLGIGSGQGYLQDIVPDYTGLDISPSVGRYYHKRFVLGSATSMPFEDNSFDASWTIWVFEHVPNPEAALREARRVVKDGGVLFLAPAWDAVPWAADGYDVRPYSDFGLGGKIVKAAIPARLILRGLTEPLIHASLDRVRKLSSGPATFHYRRLTPNFQTYW